MPNEIKKMFREIGILPDYGTDAGLEQCDDPNCCPQEPIVIEGKEAIQKYQLLVWRGAITLEAKGLKHSSGRSVTAFVKRTLGIKGNRDKVLAELERRING